MTIPDVRKALFPISGVVVLTVIGCKTQGTISPNRQVKTQEINQLFQCVPNISKLAGTIKQEAFPGPPNYTDISKGDEPEAYWILKLEHAIDVAKDPAYPVTDENEPELNVREVQLNLDYGRYRQFLNKRVVVIGELTQGFTVHHKTAVLLDVQDIWSVE